MMMERLATSVPIMTCGGNHEVGDGEAWVSYKARYPMPFRQSGSTDGTYWSRNIGPAHVISLNSYAASNEGSLQHRWLVADLGLVDRVKTPWVIAMNHAPWCVVCTRVLKYYTRTEVVLACFVGWDAGGNDDQCVETSRVVWCIDLVVLVHGPVPS
jgi:hypothetical protein